MGTVNSGTLQTVSMVNITIPSFLKERQHKRLEMTLCDLKFLRNFAYLIHIEFV